LMDQELLLYHKIPERTFSSISVFYVGIFIITDLSDES